MNAPSTTTKQEQQAGGNVERARPRSMYRPNVDILDTPEGVLLISDLPGVTERDVDVSLEKDVLTLRAKVEPPKHEGYTLTVEEYGVGDFERSFTVSNEVDRNAIDATVKDGVLRVRLPKLKGKLSTKIAVSAG